ncbi:MAG: protein kinase [Pseudomonadales bacterium]|nr:protein kinase [Pseudomonadales bacterium]
MGVVYKAKDRRQEEAGELDPFIALKVLNPEFRDDPKFLIALQQETKKTQLLSHHNIVNVYDFDRDGDIVFMTMELLKGQSLDELIQDNGLPTTQEALFNIIRGMAHGLEYAHANGIVHSDFKPSNIFIENNGSVKIFDFGIARALDKKQESNARSTRFESIELTALTPLYASISMLEGKPVRKEDDYYGLGCVAYMVLAKQHPYSRKNAKEVLECNLSVKRIEQLSRHQWQSLCGMIDVSGDPEGALDRMMNAFFPQPLGKTTLYRISFLTLVPALIVVLSMGNVWTQNRAAMESIVVKMSDAEITATELLVALTALSMDRREYVINEMRGSLLTYYQRAVSELSDLKRENYDLLLANQLIGGLENIFVDSARVTTMKAKLVVVQNKALQQLKPKYAQLRYDQIYWNPSGDWDIAKAVALIRKTKNAVSFLEESQVRNGYIRYIKERIFYDDLVSANAAISKAKALYPNDKILNKLSTDIEHSMAVQPASADVNLHSENIFKLNQKKLKITDGIHKQIQQMVSRHLSRRSPSNKAIANFMVELKKIAPLEYVSVKKGVEMQLAESLEENDTLPEQQRESAVELARMVLPKQYKASSHKIVKRINCPVGLAGKGKESRYRCRDKIKGMHLAPLLVVIPGNKPRESFAMSRNEITAREYSDYCRSDKMCKLGGDTSDLPKTNLSLRQIKDYIVWLSNQTGEQYRLPTNAEWTRAAAMSDLVKVKDHNCHVLKNGKVIRGSSLRKANTGYEDAYGLQNMIGNTAEVTQDKRGVWIRGGSYETRFSLCDSTVKSNFDGFAKADVGFRLLRLINF